MKKISHDWVNLTFRNNRIYSFKLFSSLPNEYLTLRFFRKSQLHFKSTMILPVRSETTDHANPYIELKYETQNSRQLFHKTLVKTLEDGIKKFNQGKYKEAEVDFDLVTNSFSGFEIDDLTTHESRLLSSALTRKAEITTKVLPSSLWDVALDYAKMAYELDQTSEHAQDVYFSIKSELAMDLSEQVLETSSTDVSSHN